MPTPEADGTATGTCLPDWLASCREVSYAVAGAEIREHKSETGTRPIFHHAEGGKIVPCSQGPVTWVCLPADVPRENVPRIEGLILRQRFLNPGRYLYRVDEEFASLFVVRSGCLKTTVPDRRLHRPGVRGPGMSRHDPGMEQGKSGRAYG